MRALAAAALMLLVPLTCSAEFRSLDVEALRITIDTDWAQHITPGYVPVRLDVTNLADARVIEIAVQGTRFSRMMRSGWAVAHVLQRVRLGRGDRVRFTLPIPVFAESENFQFEIQEDGRTLTRFGSAGFSSATAPANASALIVADPSGPFGGVAAALARPASGPTATLSMAGAASPTRSTTPMLDIVLEPARLPANWLGYTSLRAVVIGPAEWAALEDAQRDALLTWTACGGDLIVAADDQPRLTGGAHRVPDPSPNGASRPYFFGRIHRRAAPALAAAGLGTVLSDAESAQDAPHWALPVNRALSWNAIGPKGYRLEIPGVNGVPTRAYLAILILFAFLIGPINYWVLRHRQRLVLFMLTAPLISALFIVLLAGYVVAGEGFHVSGRAATFTMLDQPRRQAVTRGSVSLYAAGMTPGGGLRFPRDVAVYALGPDGNGSRDEQTLDLSDTQQFSSGVISARAPTNVEEIAFREARERLTFERGADGVRVVNGLGAIVQRLVYRSAGKTYVLDAPLADGAAAALRPGTIDASAIVPRDLPMPARFIRLFQAQPEGSYLAVLDRSPFWDPGVRDVVERGSFHLVLGWPDGQR
jgi:hypothetical protein